MDVAGVQTCAFPIWIEESKRRIEVPKRRKEVGATDRSEERRGRKAHKTPGVALSGYRTIKAKG
ncbi:hypothetical protein, partial [Lysinibacillus agricola]|uniref:hypothetical protein n=1 Tax=Lysinibacillus agricola TaxID=2590012 RepID=UPI003C307585